MQTLLLIGATGQIGHALLNTVSVSSSQQFKVTILARKPISSVHPNVTTVTRPFFNQSVFSDVLTKHFDHVVYSVGLPEQYLQDPSLFEKVNHTLFKEFLQAFVRSGSRRLTYVSTYEVFQCIDGLIRENHPLASPDGKTPYYQGMIRSYGDATVMAHDRGIVLTTVHPAAVYGGLNTGNGFTNYLLNLTRRNFFHVPFIFDGRFPLVHVDSLADGIMRAMGRKGAFIFCDQMTSLSELANLTARFTKSLRPITLPVSFARSGAKVLDRFARLTDFTPILSSVQVAYIRGGCVPLTERAQNDLSWKSLPLEEGVQRFLSLQTKRQR